MHHSLTKKNAREESAVAIRWMSSLFRSRKKLLDENVSRTACRQAGESSSAQDMHNERTRLQRKATFDESFSLKASHKVHRLAYWEKICLRMSLRRRDIAGMILDTCLGRLLSPYAQVLSQTILLHERRKQLV